MGGRVEPVFSVGASDRGTAHLAQEDGRQILLRRSGSWSTISRRGGVQCSADPHGAKKETVFFL